MSRLSKMSEMAEKTTKTTGVDCLVFGVGDEEFCIHHSCVIEVRHGADVLELPNVPPWVRGVIRRDERFITVVDLRILLGVPAAFNAATSVVVIELSSGPTGIVVDGHPYRAGKGADGNSPVPLERLQDLKRMEDIERMLVQHAMQSPGVLH